MPIENLLFSNEVIHGQYGYFERPRFHSQRTEKNPQLEWDKFRQTFQPFATVVLPTPADGLPTEILFTGKDVGWCTRDANMWIGSNRRQIQEISGLTTMEGEAYFGIGLKLCREISQNSGINHAFAIGFNPLDLGRPGHHNVNWLHAHLHAYDDPLDTQTIQPKSWKGMHWFDRLTFAEPFAQLFFDYLKHIGGNMPEAHFQAFQTVDAELSNGRICFPCDTSDPEKVFLELKAAYIAMRTEYERIEEIFTDKQLDPQTGRYIPFPQEIRHKRLDDFLQNDTIYSARSRQLLKYLAQHLLVATPRPKERENYIKSASHAHITKGFAGAINFAYDFQEDKFRFEFLPRVITSSSVAKTMFGQEGATIMGAHKEATVMQIDRRDAYLDEIVGQLGAMGLVDTVRPIHYLELEDMPISSA